MGNATGNGGDGHCITACSESGTAGHRSGNRLRPTCERRCCARRENDGGRPSRPWAAEGNSPAKIADWSRDNAEGDGASRLYTFGSDRADGKVWDDT